MPENKHLKFLLFVVYAILIYFFVVKIFPRIAVLFMPFILAYIVAAITNPLIRLLNGKLKCPKWLATSASLIVMLIILTSFITLGINKIISELTELLQQIPYFIRSISYNFERISLKWSIIYENLPPQTSIYLNDFISNLTSTITSLLTPLTKYTINSATNIASSLPSYIIFIVAFILASIFMTGDYDMIKKSLLMQIPEGSREKVLLIKKYTGIALGKYLQGMGVILFITFSELLIGFIILKVKYAFTLALITAFVDIIPVLGTGTILIPWIIFTLITGNVKLGFGLFIIYVVISIVRQFVEPKVMSSSFGTYPLVTLVAMYVGLKIFGVFGMILGPIVIVVLIYLQRSGVISFWKTKN